MSNTALYDMEEDPGQTMNVIDQHSEVVEEMRAAYDAWWNETLPLMVNEAAPLSPTRPFHELYNKQRDSTRIPAWRPPSL